MPQPEDVLCIHKACNKIVTQPNKKSGKRTCLQCNRDDVDEQDVYQVPRGADTHAHYLTTNNE